MVVFSKMQVASSMFHSKTNKLKLKQYSLMFLNVNNMLLYQQWKHPKQSILLKVEFWK